MQKVITYILMFLFMGCWAGCEAIDDTLPAEPVMVNLQLSVATAEMAGNASTRAYDYESPACEGEKIQTLRIIIVRPGYIVEHNKYYDLTTPTTQTGYYQFQVVAEEDKQIYFIVNEMAQKKGTSENLENIVNYNFDGIAEGTTFNKEAIEALSVSVNQGSDQLRSGDTDAGVLIPMNERYTVNVGTTDVTQTYYVTRVATKFTYIIKNTSSFPCTLSNIAINKMASKAYFFPQGEITYTSVSDDYNTLGQMDLTNYAVPLQETNGYYTFSQSYNQTIGGNSEETLSSIYLLEGRYEDTQSAGTQNKYNTTLTINGAELTAEFPELEQLPRNTHVVVIVTINERSHSWTVDVRPYAEADLRPGFGI
ncbi:MAG: hypothetical protein IJZ86_03715 [Bacteroides sp.]|nr:hypothetical protein [Bacteroides sp.]